MTTVDPATAGPFTATISIGFSSSLLYILDERRRGPALNLVWGSGANDDRTPAGRADVLLAQNGYRRTGPWTPGRAGDSAPVEVVGPVSRCSCWYDEHGAVVAGDYWCLDHPEERQAQAARTADVTRLEIVPDRPEGTT